mgnify:CR=1 FL=1
MIDVGLQWNPTTSLKDWSSERLENIRKLIIQTTGESYRIDRLSHSERGKSFPLKRNTEKSTIG